MLHTIVQISDTHLANSTGAQQNPQTHDPLTKLKWVFDDIQTHISAERIVITGDLVHEGNAADYAQLRTFLDQKSQSLGIPISVTLGNHDRRAAFHQGFLNEPPQAGYYSRIDGGDYELFCLDTKAGDTEPGRLEAAQLTWLQHALAEGTKPALIFMHHPVYAPALGAMQYSVLQNGDELKALIDGSRVIGVFSGHIHFPVSFVDAGCLYATADSTAYHIDCRNPHNHELSDATAYSVITFDDTFVGSEIRLVQHEAKVLAHIPVENTDFVG